MKFNSTRHPAKSLCIDKVCCSVRLSKTMFRHFKTSGFKTSHFSQKTMPFSCRCPEDVGLSFIAMMNLTEQTPHLHFCTHSHIQTPNMVNEDINSMEEICASTLICRYGRSRREQYAKKSGSWLLSRSRGIIYTLL